MARRDGMPGVAKLDAATPHCSHALLSKLWGEIAITVAQAWHYLRYLAARGPAEPLSAPCNVAFVGAFAMDGTFAELAACAGLRPPRPCLAAFSASRIAPQCLHTATPGFTFSPHAGQSAKRVGTYAHSRSTPSAIAARRCKSEISRKECPRAYIVSPSATSR